MLTEKDGALFVEWKTNLFHGISVEFFLSLLRSESLHFSRTNVWFDPQEGLAAIPYDHGIEELTLNGTEIRKSATNYYGHCWTRSDVYDVVSLTDNDSVAREVGIRTTFRALHKSILQAGVCGGLVSYRNFADFRGGEESDLSDFSRFFIKDLPFGPEREFRLLLPIDQSERDPASINVLVDLRELLVEVFVRKRVSDDKFEEIRAEMKRIGIVDRLGRHPIF